MGSGLLCHAADIALLLLWKHHLPISFIVIAWPLEINKVPFVILLDITHKPPGDQQGTLPISGAAITMVTVSLSFTMADLFNN